jgi:hypothetical protein
VPAVSIFMQNVDLTSNSLPGFAAPEFLQVLLVTGLV